VTLPLSYSRLRGSPASLTRRFGGQARRFLPNWRGSLAAASAGKPAAFFLSCHHDSRPTCEPCPPTAGQPTIVLRTFPRCQTHSLARATWRPARAAASGGEGWPASRSSRSERRLVAREGFEPSKPLGRQIYSLLRLTASLPRRASDGSAPEHAPPLTARTLTCQDLRRSREYLRCV